MCIHIHIYILFTCISVLQSRCLDVCLAVSVWLCAELVLLCLLLYSACVIQSCCFSVSCFTVAVVLQREDCQSSHNAWHDHIFYCFIRYIKPLDFLCDCSVFKLFQQGRHCLSAASKNTFVRVQIRVKKHCGKITTSTTSIRLRDIRRHGYNDNPVVKVWVCAKCIKNNNVDCVVLLTNPSTLISSLCGICCSIIASAAFLLFSHHNYYEH